MRALRVVMMIGKRQAGNSAAHLCHAHRTLRGKVSVARLLQLSELTGFVIVTREGR